MPLRDTPRAMSQENVEAFRHGLEAGNRGDVETLLEVLDPELEWHSALHALLGLDPKEALEAATP